jgi:hypothetical protein
VAEQTKKRLSDGDNEQNTVQVPAALPPNKKQKQNVSGKACDADSFFAQLAGLSRQGDGSAIVQGMLTHSEHAGVQQQACVVLRSLSLNDCNKLMIAEAGGIEAVVAAMKTHKTNDSVQKYACWALWYLAINNGNKVKIAVAGGLEAVVSAIKAHQTRVFVQQYACLALLSLAAKDSLRQRIKTAGAGGVECVKHAVNASNATTDTKRWGNDLLDKLK